MARNVSMLKNNNSNARCTLQAHLSLEYSIRDESFFNLKCKVDNAAHLRFLHVIVNRGSDCVDLHFSADQRRPRSTISKVQIVAVSSRNDVQICPIINIAQRRQIYTSKVSLSDAGPKHISRIYLVRKHETFQIDRDYG